MEKDLEKNLDDFLENEKDIECDENQEVCYEKNSKDLIEKVDKKIITQDGRQLLI